jgi:hypothetical protein
MKLKYTHKEDLREAVAFKFHMEGEPETIGLCIRIAKTNKAVWLYHDGDSNIGSWRPEDADVLFYEDDTIELTF